jgi:uncharacterized delta-60 repeat protein
MKKTIYIFLLFLVHSKYCSSQLPGDLDFSFGTNGKILHPSSIYTDGIQNIAIQNDGKILAVGSKNSLKYFVMRLNSDGSIDNTFGQSGIIEDSLLGEAWGHDVKVDALGRILVTGYTRHWNAGWLKDMFVVRLLQDGSYDNTFGNNGIFVSYVSQPNPPTKENSGRKIIILNDGNILIGGLFDYGTSVNPDFAVYKITSSGQFDNSFGTNGYVYYHVSGMDALMDIFLQNDGKILLTGRTFNPVIVPLLRLNSNGSLDNTFGTNGVVLIDFLTPCQNGISVIQLDNGKILLSGSKGSCSSLDFYITRLDSNGQIDNSFGINGFNFFDNGSKEIMKSMILLPDNNILLTGTSAENMLMVCYDSLGVINNSFANNGNLIIDFDGNNDDAHCSAVQPDGKLLVSGFSFNTSSSLSYCPFARLYSTYISVNEVDAKEFNFSVYPNPSNINVNLIFSQQNSLPEYYEIVNVSGKVIAKEKIYSSNTTISLSHLPPSIYLIHLIDKGRIIGSKKISIRN